MSVSNTILGSTALYTNFRSKFDGFRCFNTKKRRNIRERGRGNTIKKSLKNPTKKGLRDTRIYKNRQNSGVCETASKLSFAGKGERERETNANVIILHLSVER